MDATASSTFDSKLVDFCKRAFARGLFTAGAASAVDAIRGSSAAVGRLAFQREQARKRAAAAGAGRPVPPILIASVTRRCNLDCAGCYSKALRPPLPGRASGTGGAVGAVAPAELSDDRFMELFREALDLGVGTILLAGGEPCLRRGLLERVAGLKGLVAPVFTNGTLFDSSWLELFSAGSLIPVFSVEGDESFTSARRGEGVHEAVLEAAATLRERRALFGLSITVTSRNFDTVLSPAFLERVDRLGASALFLVEYEPVVPGTEELALGSELHAALVGDPRLGGLPYPVLSLPGDEEASGGCMAAGRGFIHLAPDGAVEACPFAPVSDSSAAASSLAEALDSPLMRELRERSAELAGTGGGCALRRRGGWVASLARCATKDAAAPAGRAAGAA